jgi:hypothetical protein
VVAQIRIEITADASRAQRAADDTASSFDKFSSGMATLAVPAGIAAGAIGMFGKAAVDAASATEQALGAVDSTFGGSAGKVKEWAAAAAQSVGMSESSYAQLAAVVGKSMQSMGLDQAAAADATGNLITVGADLAATMGGTTQEAVEALGSALRGEADPAERFGLNLKDATVKAKMAADGTDKLTGAAFDAAKAQAIMALATEQAGAANGAFARESDTAAGSAQIAAAEYENAKAALGEGLLPIVAAVTEALAGLAQWVGENSTLVLTLVGVVGALAAGILAVNAAIALASAAQAAWSAIQLVGKGVTAAMTAVQWALNAAMSANPVMLVVLAIAALIAGIVLLWQNSEDFRNFILGMWEAIAAAAAACWEAIKSAVGAAWDWIKDKANTVGDFLKGLWESIRGAAATAWEAVKSVVTGVWDGIKSAISAVVDWLVSAWENVKSVGVSCWQAIKSAVDVLLTPFRAVKDAVQWLIDKLKQAWDWAVKVISKIPFVGGMVSSSSAPATLSAGSVAAASGAVARYGAVSLSGRSARPAGGGIVVNVSGALDPVAVAEQIESLLLRQRRRLGGVDLA